MHKTEDHHIEVAAAEAQQKQGVECWCTPSAGVLLFVKGVVVLLLLILLSGTALLWHRNRVVRRIVPLVKAAPGKSIEELESQLTAFRATKYQGADISEGMQHVSFFLPSLTGLHVYAPFDPTSRRIAEAKLVYFRSEDVNLETGEGAGPSPSKFFHAFGLWGLGTLLCWGASRIPKQGFVRILAIVLMHIAAGVAFAMVLLEDMWFLLHFGILGSLHWPIL